MASRKTAATIAATLGLLLAGTGTAFATVSYPGGGTWSYGTRGSGTEVYSNYHHPTVAHRASTINAWGEYSCTSANGGSWANNSQRAKRGDVDRSYWAKVRCGY